MICLPLTIVPEAPIFTQFCADLASRAPLVVLILVMLALLVLGAKAFLSQ